MPKRTDKDRGPAKRDDTPAAGISVDEPNQRTQVDPAHGERSERDDAIGDAESSAARGDRDGGGLRPSVAESAKSSTPLESTDEPGLNKRIADAGKDMLEKGVETLGSGLETLGEGVSKLAEVSKGVPLVGTGVAKLGHSLTSAGESLHELPRVARTKRGRVLVRSAVIAFCLVAAWISVIVVLQTRRTDSPDFRPYVERILTEIGKGRAAIEELYEHASPRFQEVVRKERFIDDMTDLTATVGKFIEVTSIYDTIVTSGPTGRIGRLSAWIQYERGETRAAVSLHWDEGDWKLLGVSVLQPADVQVTQAVRENRVSACKDPMDVKRCEIHAVAHRILEQLRDGHADEVWARASDVFRQQEQKPRFVQIQAEHREVLGEYRRIIAVTEAKVISGGTRGYFDVLVEYSKANVRATFGLIRASKSEPWTLRSLKVVLPMPRVDDPLATGNGSSAPLILNKNTVN